MEERTSFPFWKWARQYLLRFLRPRIWVLVLALLLLGVAVGFQQASAKLFGRASDVTRALSSEVWSESGPDYNGDLKLHAEFIELCASDLEARFRQHSVLYAYVKMLPIVEPWVGLREAKVPLEKEYSSRDEAKAALARCGKLLESRYAQFQLPLFRWPSYGPEPTSCTPADIYEAKKAIEEFKDFLVALPRAVDVDALRLMVGCQLNRRAFMLVYGVWPEFMQEPDGQKLIAQFKRSLSEYTSILKAAQGETPQKQVQYYLTSGERRLSVIEAKEANDAKVVCQEFQKAVKKGRAQYFASR